MAKEIIKKVVIVKYAKIHKMLFFFSDFKNKNMKIKIEKIKKIDEILLFIGKKKLINKLMKPIKKKPNIQSL